MNVSDTHLFEIVGCFVIWRLS